MGIFEEITDGAKADAAKAGKKTIMLDDGKPCELLPCPKCQSENVGIVPAFYQHGTLYCIACGNCGLHGATGLNLEKVVLDWNTRVPPLPGSLFRELFPDGAKLQRVGKYEVFNIHFLRAVLESSDVELLRETVIGVLYHYATAVDHSAVMLSHYLDALDSEDRDRNQLAALQARIDALESQSKHGG